MSGQFTINAGSYKSYAFTIPSSWNGGYVAGSYSVSGGNITFWVFRASGYAAWQSNSSAIPSYFCYGGVNDRGTLDCRIGTGDYYVVFDNVSPNVFGHVDDVSVSKTVTAQISIQQNP